MKEVFEKIITAFEEKIEYDNFDYFEEEPFIKMPFEEVEQTIIKVAEEYGKDTNVPSNDSWIPTSEGLPKDRGWYQCTCGDEELWSKPIVRDLFYYPSIKLFVDNIRYSEHGCEDIKKYDWTKYVTAWQPLPEPYKPKGE